MIFAAFWAAVASVVVTYVVMPLLVLLRGRLVRRPVMAGDVTPSVSVVIAAYNEEASIGSKIANVLASDYPSSRLELIVASDGSADRTVEVAVAAAAAGGERVTVLDLPRLGKADALNAAVERATGEIVVFSDANSMLAPDALREIVRPFADPVVGGVAGDQRYDAGNDAAGERAYWDLDRALKIAESRAGNTISATGALYAIRRELFTPVIVGVTDDFYVSTGVIVSGRRLVFAPDAAAYEPPAASTGVEFNRKVRIMTRGLRGVVRRRELLDPRRTGFYAVQLLWHKVLRRLVAVPLVVIAVTAPVLARRGRFYLLATIAQAAFYVTAGAGIRRAQRPATSTLDKLVALPAYFCMVNAAALKASWNVVTGRRVDRWETVRSTETDKST